MLAIRMQRTGRSGHAQFRVVVQDSRFSPKSGRVVAYLGNYNPHTKTAALDGEKLGQYLDNGAQPSQRVAQLLQKEGVKLPAWVKLAQDKKRSVRKPEKRRSTAPAEVKEEKQSEATAPSENPTEEPSAEEKPAEAEINTATETPAEEPEVRAAEEAPAESEKSE